MKPKNVDIGDFATKQHATNLSKPGKLRVCFVSQVAVLAGCVSCCNAAVSLLAVLALP